MLAVILCLARRVQQHDGRRQLARCVGRRRHRRRGQHRRRRRQRACVLWVVGPNIARMSELPRQQVLHQRGSLWSITWHVDMLRAEGLFAELVRHRVLRNTRDLRRNRARSSIVRGCHSKSMLRATHGVRTKRRVSRAHLSMHRRSVVQSHGAMFQEVSRSMAQWRQAVRQARRMREHGLVSLN